MDHAQQSSTNGPQQSGARILPFRPPGRLQDPLDLIQSCAPPDSSRIVLWTLAGLTLVLGAWAGFCQLDIVSVAEGRLVPQSLVKIVQPVEAGVVREWLVHEGDRVTAGQVVARLDSTLAVADRSGTEADLAAALLQERRIEAELSGQPLRQKAGDDPQRFAEAARQFEAHRRQLADSLAQEQALLSRAEHELRSSAEVRQKLEQALPVLQRNADAFADLGKSGYVPDQLAADKAREAMEKERDLAAQRGTVAASQASVEAQRRKISLLQSASRSALEGELAEVRARLRVLNPNRDKTLYREQALILRAPTAGVIKDLAQSTAGTVVQPGAVLMTLVPEGEPLFADVLLGNQDVGFLREGQPARIKLAAYPFQRYGALEGKVESIGADAQEPQPSASSPSAGNPAGSTGAYKIRVRLIHQFLDAPDGRKLDLTPGMHVQAEFIQGSQSVWAYLLSPLRKVVQEAGRER